VIFLKYLLIRVWLVSEKKKKKKEKRKKERD
jgi:hypothetical protein